MTRVRRSTRKQSGLRTLLTAALVAVTAWGQAEARTVRIVSADTLELRTVDGQELVVIAGEGVELRVDDDVVKARRVEFNRTRRTLTLVGAASYRSEKDGQDLRGENLVIDLGAEQVTGEDVLISDAALEIRGQEVERIPGQLRASGGYFTTCARCGRTPNDFAFRAERLIVYPGDRLVAYRAQVLIVDVPVLFLPVLVLPLNEKDRQPRFQVGSGGADGFTVLADLPFSLADNTLGTTLLRYYQNRTPSFGAGVALRSYAPLPFVDRLDLYTLANPRPVGAEGLDLDLDLTAAGRVPLASALRDLDYRLNVLRRDIGRAGTDPEKGVTRVTFGAKVDYPLFTAELNYVDRFGPEPTTALSTPLRQPEVILDPKPYTSGNLSVDTRFSAGQYTAKSNPLSRSASAQGVNISTSRLEEAHDISYSTVPWPNAEFSVRNTFTGRYYGTGARTVQLSVQAALTGRFNVDNTLGLTAGYVRNEGTSPFEFDAIGRRYLSAPLGVTLSTVPARGVTFGAAYTRDLFLAPQDQAPARFTLNVNRLPLTLGSTLTRDLDSGEVKNFDYSFTLADPDSGTLKVRPAQPATATTPAAPQRTERSSEWPAPQLAVTGSGGYSDATGLKPFRLGFTVTGDTRTNNFSAYAQHDLQTPGLNEFGVSFSLAPTQDMVLNPYSVTGRETVTLKPAARAQGNLAVNWRGAYTFSTAHDLLLNRPAEAKDSGTLTFSVGTVAGGATNWNLTYGGPFDLERFGWTRPTLTAAYRATRPGQSFGVGATLNVVGFDQPRTELSRADLDANWQFGGRASLSGRALYTRTRSGARVRVSVALSSGYAPLRLGVAIGPEDKPGAYLTGRLEQTFTWVDGVRQDIGPVRPVIGLTIDRCCWALQAEADLKLGRYRLAVGLPGQTNYPLFDLTENGFDVPLLPRF